MSSVKVKICGLRRPREAELAADLGADFLGLNFYSKSPRYLSLGEAREVAAAVLGRAVRLVGVFVDQPIDEVEDIAGEVGLDYWQFHGHESPEELAPHASRAIKALRVRDQLDPAALEPWEGLWGLLLDTYHPELAGGSGESWSFSSLRGAGAGQRLFMAGGLAPHNVADALAAAGDVWGLDVCSGLESAPGRKDPELMKRFFDEIHRAQSEHEESKNGEAAARA